MALYEITDNRLVRQQKVTFNELTLYERADLQRLLRDDIGVLNDNLLVIAEEYAQWADARRRVDLLAVDREAHLVVIELKRTEDGGHMDLQAVRYAAMVSAMRFDDVVDTYASHAAKQRPGEDVDARGELLDWFGVEEGGEETVISSDVRIILVSADFGPEITTTVLWLNRFEGMDIRCVRLVPYRLDERVLLDVQQLIPLPEAADYQVRLRQKQKQQERSRGDGRDRTRYQVVIDGQVLPQEHYKRQAVRVVVESLVERGVPARSIGEVLGGRFRSIEGEVDDRDAVVAALRADDTRFDPVRWFVEFPICEDGLTWVLSNQWGTQTEGALRDLSEAFPEAKVTFRPAESV